jgi:hypothetical protein
VLAAFSFNVAFACMPRPLRSPLFLLFAVIALHYDVDLSDSDKEVALICYGYLHLAICTTGRSLSFDALGRALPVRQRNNAAYEHMTYTVILLRFFRFAPCSTNLILATETCKCAFAPIYACSHTGIRFAHSLLRTFFCCDLSLVCTGTLCVGAGGGGGGAGGAGGAGGGDDGGDDGTFATSCSPWKSELSSTLEKRFWILVLVLCLPGVWLVLTVVSVYVPCRRRRWRR